MLMISLVLVFIAFLFFFVYQCFFHYKKSQGSPFLTTWPFLGMCPGVLLILPRAYEWTAEILQASDLNYAFKGVLFSGTDFLLTADPRNINHILCSNFGNYPKGPEFKKMFDVLGDGIITLDGELWEDLRKSNHAIFHHQDFLELSRSTNIMSLFIETPEVKIAEAADLGEETIFYRHFQPMILWKLQRWIGIGLEGKMRTLIVTLDQIYANIISSKREKISSGKSEPSMDVLTYYMNVDTTKYKLLKPRDDKFIRDVLLTLLLAGRDTTSSALTWFFWLVSTHPQVIAKIRDEISTKFDPADLGKLVYLHAALSESMRLYPPIPLNHKSATKSDVLPSGHKLEANSRVLISIYALGRMRSVWGEDASDFKPERWISDKGTIRHEPSYKFLAFNAGPRTCLGKHLALSQMKMVAVNIIRNYDFKIVEGHRIEPVPSISLDMKHGLKVTVSKKI